MDDVASMPRNLILSKETYPFGIEVLDSHTTDTRPNTLAWIHRPRRV